MTISSGVGKMDWVGIIGLVVGAMGLVVGLVALSIAAWTAIMGWKFDKEKRQLMEDLRCAHKRETNHHRREMDRVDRLIKILIDRTGGHPC